MVVSVDKQVFSHVAADLTCVRAIRIINCVGRIIFQLTQFSYKSKFKQ